MNNLVNVVPKSQGGLGEFGKSDFPNRECHQIWMVGSAKKHKVKARTIVSKFSAGDSRMGLKFEKWSTLTPNISEPEAVG